MIVRAKFAAIKGIQPHEYALRFFFGGLVCVMAGLIARRWGPGVGGLFLAFPAIFPASATLVESHEKKHKARAGYDGTKRGRVVAGVDAAGTAIGCFGLACFAVVFWLGLTRWPIYVVAVTAILAWLGLSIGIWLLHKMHLFHKKNTQKHD